MAERQGITSTLVMGVGALIIATIVVLVIISTLWGSNLLRTGSTSASVVDETGFLNATKYQIAAWDNEGLNKSLAISTIANISADADHKLITSGNYTFNAATGILENKTVVMWPKVEINYTYSPPTDYEDTAEYAGENFKTGVGNVSSKIPTLLLLAAIVLLLGVVVLLVRQTQSMGAMGGGSL